MKNIFFILFILTSYSGYTQQCDNVLKGNIIDFHDNSALENATIRIIGTNRITISDNQGEFTFKNLCNSVYELEISHVACKTKQVTLEVAGDTFKSISIEHHIEELDQISIKGTSKTETKTAQETILKSNVLERYSSLSLGDALKEVSGVSSLNTGNTIVKPMINGLHSSRILIMNNGVRQQDQEWGIEHAPSIDINNAGQISVIKGSGALAYGGDAVGGVIVLNPSRIINRDTLYGKTILGGQTNGRGYNISTSLNKNYNTGWFAQAQGSYKRNGDFKAPDYNLTNTGLDSKGFAARVGKRNFESGFELHYSYLNNEIGILGASHIGSVFDIARAINSGQPLLIRDFSYTINAPKQDITHHLAKANYYKRFRGFGKVAVQYDYQYNKRLEFDVRIGDRRNIPAIDLTLQTHSILADVDLDANLDRKINFGVLGRYQNNFANPDTGVRRLIPDYDKYEFGTYIVTEWNVNDKLLIDAGIRYDYSRIDAKKFYRTSRWEERGYDVDFADIVIEEFPTQLLTNPIFNYHNFSATAGLNFELDKTNSILFNYSLASRPPNPSELFSDGLHHSAARIELGDLRFNKEVSNRVSLSHKLNSKRLNIVSEIFYNRINNFIYLRPFAFTLTGRGPFPVWAYQQTDAELYGIDLTVTYEINDKLHYLNKSSLTKGYDLETDLALIDIPPFSTFNQIKYTNANWYNFSAALKSEWVFEQNDFPDFNFEVEDQLTEEMVLIDISTPPPAFHLVHFYTEATFSLSQKTRLNIGLGVNNLFDTTYRNYLNRLRFFADDLGRNFTLQLQLNY
ncbi:TonB-dependent receptor [uncultured Winogradskyella sp.]|uniref:TonB-dependent receptor n=1 Tax=uncultured Winogradskyella sp. TaxID=395353 RepID=UPI0026143A88|nr:TonB-dependent receptor [uncultured Winogradskyella sp.]